LPRLARPALRLLALPVLIALAVLAVRDGAAPVAVADPRPAIVVQNVLDETLAADRSVDRSCHTGWRAGEAGVATATTPSGPLGPVLARLDADGGDWDLAVFDASGRLVAGNAGAGSDEVAQGWTGDGVLRVQACRRSGDDGTARVTIERGTVPQALIDEARATKLQIVSVRTPTRADKARLTSLGLDLTEHGGHQSLGVVLHGEGDAAKLRAAGFDYAVKVPDLVTRSAADLKADARYARSTARSDVPSGRTTYRMLADYNDELKKLADENPGLVKLIELPERTGLGNAVFGIEITTDVEKQDGKPAFLNMGVHHAREWPSGEHAMEWAYELINGYKAKDPRIVKIVEQSRNIVVPIVNPDGFDASRSAGGRTGGDGGRDENNPDSDLVTILALSTITGGEYRRKNCRIGETDAHDCLTATGAASNGTDPNRNYGGLWGGPGAEGEDVTSEVFRGPGPFSEPETRNVQALVSQRQVMSLITNHTTAGLVLRAPGLAALGDPVDENRGYKALGDAMALENGYFSQKSFELYDTTGTTEDWSYNVTGGFGFTFEIYCGEPNYATGDCDDPAFHPLYATQAAEYTGDSDQNNHVNDPGRSEETPFGMQAGYDGKGNSEAYKIAAESAINEARHSIIEGTAPAGAKLRLVKEFKTQTFPQPQEDGALAPLEFDDRLETVYDVGADGRFRWHVNPSTRPIVAKPSGREKRGEPSEAQDLGTQTPPAVTCGGVLNPDFEGTPCAKDVPFEVPSGPGIDNASATIRLDWQTIFADYDASVFRVDENGDRVGTALASSEIRGADFEQVTLNEPGGKYVLRVFNQTKTNIAPEPFSVDITFNPPQPPNPGTVESYTMTCEVGEQVLHTTQVTVDRGEVVTPDLGPCSRRTGTPSGTPTNPGTTTPGTTTPGTTAPGTSTPGATAPGTSTPGATTPGGGGGGGTGATGPSAGGCTPDNGFRSVAVRPGARRLSLAFDRAVNAPVTVDVFQQSVGRRVVGERLVARFTGRSSSVAWDGRANRSGRRVTDGYYFVRFRIVQPGGQTDVRRITLRRVRGRFTARPDFYRRAACDLLRSFKLERPVFGGRTSRALNVSYRLTDGADVTVTVSRGAERIRTFTENGRVANRTYRLRLGSGALRTGDYTVTLVARRGTTTVRSTLTARRL